MAATVNWLDRAIGWVAPHRALQRESARVALGRVREYQAAKSGRRTSGWTSAGTSANAEIAPALATLRARSREQIRNNPYASIAVNKLAVKAVGTGILPRHTNKRAGSLWKDWVKTADFDGHFDFYGLQNLIAQGLFESGEVLIRRHYDKSAAGVPLRLQVLEPDYLDSTKQGPLPGGNHAIAGVEINPQGQRVAYHLYRQHPGDSLVIKYAFESVRVPASEVIHLYEKRRPGQLRGIPRLSTSLMRLRDLDEYEDAELVRKKIEACFAAFVTTSDASRVVANSQTETTSDGTSNRIETLAPGLIEYLKPGEQISFGTPSSSAGFGEYTRTQLHAIAVGCGVTYQQLTGDLTSVNLSSIRAGMIDFNEMIDQFRWLTFIPIVCERINAWFVEAAYLANLNRSQDASVLWTPPKRQWVDPTKEVDAARLERQAGMVSLSEQIRQKGDDPEQTFAEIAAENQKLAELGIVIDTDPAHKLAADAAKADAAASANDGSGDNKPNDGTDGTDGGGDGGGSGDGGSGRGGPGARSVQDDIAGLARDFSARVDDLQRDLARELGRISATSRMPDVHIHQGDHHIAPPEVRIEQGGTVVNVPPAEVRIENQVNPTPVTVENRVNPTPVTIRNEQPPAEVNVHLPARQTTTVVERDALGRLTGATQTETDVD